ncbi:MAG: MaoC/PaaZ C-terminal domain-containing protein [Nocardioidaceae bacterium]
MSDGEADMKVRVLDESPPLGSLYVKTVLPSLPGAGLLGPPAPSGDGHTLPDLRLELCDSAPDSEHIEAYREVCDFPLRESLPATYPHLLAFPLHLLLMTEPGFPFAAMGVVHIANRIEQRRPVGVTEVIDLAVWSERLAPHRNGRTVTIVSEGSVGGEVVWRDETVLLKRGKRSDKQREASSDLPDEAPQGPVSWQLPSALGRRYAAVSGDRNPIHLYDVTARAFGFRQHIAHGMWTKAHCLAALDNRLPPSFVAEVAFKKPIALPSSVTFGASVAGDRIDFGVTSPAFGETHLLGRVTPL